VYRVLVGKPKGKKPLGRSRHRWVDKANIQKVGCGGMDRIELAQVIGGGWLHYHGDITNFPIIDILKRIYHIVHDPTEHMLYQWLSTAVIVLLMMGTESTRNM
jgi:hypothetical protein